MLRRNTHAKRRNNRLREQEVYRLSAGKTEKGKRRGRRTDGSRARDVYERAQAGTLVLDTRAVVVDPGLLAHLLREPRQEHAHAGLLHAYRRSDEEQS